jgi:hypothetical protein
MEVKQQSLNFYTEMVNKFMEKKGWFKHQCGNCDRSFFSKHSVAAGTSFCGWGKCNKGNYPFRTFSKRKKLLRLSQINTKVMEYFCSNGFSFVAPQNIANTNGQTDLIVAGVQMFDDIIHCNQQLRTDKMLVFQPCVRTQFQSQVGSQEGISTSFVNVCTEQMGASFDQHLQSIDQWLTILSNLGLHM